MGKSGNIGWGISNYFGLPNRKRKLITKDFLITLKEEIIKEDIENNIRLGHEPITREEYDKFGYIDFYGALEGTYLFDEALKSACEKHNIVKAIYDYVNKMPWYDYDCCIYDISSLMYKEGIVPYEYEYDEEQYCEEEIPYKIVTKYKGYNEVTYGTWFSDNRHSLEEIYEDEDNVEVIWLDK